MKNRTRRGGGITRASLAKTRRLRRLHKATTRQQRTRRFKSRIPLTKPLTFKLNNGTRRQTRGMSGTTRTAPERFGFTVTNASGKQVDPKRVKTVKTITENNTMALSFEERQHKKDQAKLIGYSILAVIRNPHDQTKTAVLKEQHKSMRRLLGDASRDVKSGMPGFMNQGTLFGKLSELDHMIKQRADARKGVAIAAKQATSEEVDALSAWLETLST